MSEQRFRAKSVLRMYKMYIYLQELKKEVLDSNPELYPYVKKAYYHKKVEKAFDLSPTYVSTVFNKIEKDPGGFRKDVDEAIRRKNKSESK